MAEALLAPVGWYCPGGHENYKGEMVGPSIRLDDPCSHGVPAYVLNAAPTPAEVELRRLVDGGLTTAEAVAFMGHYEQAGASTDG